MRKHLAVWSSIPQLAAQTVFLLATLYVPSIAVSEEPAQTPSEAAPTLIALLVGVQGYPNLPESERLQGCVNDVRVVKQLLLDRFGFRDDDIVELVEAQATAEAIRGGFKKLIERVEQLPEGGPRAQVLYYFSGHGSFVPDQEVGHPDCDEADGVDETQVTFDAKRQKGKEDIRDDELHQLANAVCMNDKARFLAVLDCCHSGSGARGVTKTKGLQRNLGSLPVGASGRRQIVQKILPPGAVILSACRAGETTPEYEEEDGRVHGLMTRFLVQVLEETPSLSNLSYTMLRDEIQSHYFKAGIAQRPHPELEWKGTVIQESILGVGRAADRRACWQAEPVTDDPGIVRLKAGSFHGVTVGSLHELYKDQKDIDWNDGTREKESSQASLGWLRIEDVSAASAKARFSARKGDDRSANVQEVQKRDFDDLLAPDFAGGYAVERYHDHGDFALRLWVVQAIDEHRDGAPFAPSDHRVPEAVRRPLETLSKANESKWLSWVDGDTPCDFVLRIDGQYAALFPAGGRSHVAVREKRVRDTDVPESLRGGWGPIDLKRTADAAAKLEEYLRKIARARNLLRLAETQRRNNGSSIQVALELHSARLIGLNEITGEYEQKELGAEVGPNEKGTVVTSLDKPFAIRVLNKETSQKPVYVTILYVDPDMEIAALLPQQTRFGDYVVDEQEIGPGKSCDTVFITGEPMGPQYVVALATPEPNNFYMLEQEPLERVKGLPTWNSGSSLDELLLNTSCFPGMKGRKRPHQRRLFDDSWSAAVLSWELRP